MPFEPFSIIFLYNNTEYRIGVTPLPNPCDDTPDSFEIEIENAFKGIIQFVDDEWVSYDFTDQTLVLLLGKCIHEIYEKKDKILKMVSKNDFSLN